MPLRRQRPVPVLFTSVIVAAAAVVIGVMHPPGAEHPAPAAQQRHAATPNKGKPHHMPNVIGLSVPAAEANIRSAIASPRFTTRRAGSQLPAGTVLAQIPAAGTSLAPDSHVQLIVSDGTGHQDNTGS